jgi:hypothetical protein
MREVFLEALTTLGPIVFLMLIPVLIPIVTLSIGTIIDRLKADAEPLASNA